MLRPIVLFCFVFVANHGLVQADVPLVTLKMGSSLNPDDIKEGDDVYFECNVRANPRAHRLIWHHRGAEIHHNVTAGVILSDQSLVLQSITRATAGDYTCVAVNSEGKGTSNPVQLLVRYVPVCADHRDTELYGALKQETVALRCEVDANPPLVTFHWTFNNSGEQLEVPPRLYNSEGHTSTLNYTPTTDMEYGTLACWGSNSVGHQKVPCLYQIVAAGRPFALQNCSIANQSVDSLQVECFENFDGGLPQFFMLELLEEPSLTVRYNVSTNRTPPYFEIGGLPPGVSYRLNLFAVNAKGRSDVVTLETVTFRGQAKYTDESGVLAVSPVLMSLGLLATVLAAAACGVLAALVRRRRSSPQCIKQAPPPCSDLYMEQRITPSCADHRSPPAAHAQAMCQRRADVIEAEDTEPDVIPTSEHERRPANKGYTSLQRGVIQLPVDADRTLRSPENKLNSHSYHSLGRANKGVTACSAISPGVTSSLTMHRLRPEVVTTSNRVQESCI